MPPPITSGLLWSTDVAIDFAASGPVVPAIPMPRAAGPLYCVVSAQTAGSEGVIFRVGNPDDNFHEQNTFQAERWDGLYGLMAAPGWPNQVIGEAPAISATADHLWEFWFSAAGTDFIDHQPFGFVNNDLPDQDVAASSHLFIGYRPNEGSPMDRAAGTIRRMAIYDRVPDEGERALLVAWVNGGFPVISGDYIHYRQEDVTAAGVDSAHGMSMPLGLTGALSRATVAGVEWMDCAAGVLSGAHAAWPPSSGLAVWVLADGSRPTGTAIYNGNASAALNDNAHLNFHGDGVFRTTNNTTRTAIWPVPAAAGPETFCWTAAAGVTTIAAFSLRHKGLDLGPSTMTDPSRNASRNGTDFVVGAGSNLTPSGLRWRDVVVKVGADFTPQEVAALEAYAAMRLERDDPGGATIDRQAGLVAASHVAAQRTVRRQRSAVAVAGSAVAASASTARQRGAQISATSSMAAAALPVRDRGASVGAASTVAAHAWISRRSAVSITAISSITAGPTTARNRTARMDATSAVSATASVSGVISASASIKAAASVHARPSRAIHRSAVIEAGSSVRAGSGRSVHASVGVIASSAIAARARRIVARGVTVTAAGAVHARAEVQRGSGITIAARSSITAQRRVLALRAVNVSAASVVTAAAIIVRPVIRYAYPGDPQGGVLGPTARGGVLAPSTRSGTIQRP